jgi:hypothetical protein
MPTDGAAVLVPRSRSLGQPRLVGVSVSRLESQQIIYRHAAVSIVADKARRYPVFRIDMLDHETLADCERNIALQIFPARLHTAWSKKSCAAPRRNLYDVPASGLGEG